MRIHRLSFLALALAAAVPTTASAQDQTFNSGSLIIPMDLAYQGEGMYQAYGLLYQLLDHDIDVYWIIDQDKMWHQAPCNTGGDECAWDCADVGSGPCDYPTASPDFYVGSKVVWSDAGDAAGTVITEHGYRGGPFVVDAADRDAALEIIDAWNDEDMWGANPWAERENPVVVTVHEATESFQGYVRKKLIAAPTIAVFADGNEHIATGYLLQAGIPQSNGNPFPGDKCDKIDCGPGTDNPDMLTVPSVAGDMGTCDTPNKNHKNGALFDENGEPAYCQIMSMHWNVGDREKVQCGGANCPATPEECTGVEITYHGHEVVAEVRSFLQFATHFFAECQAVNAYENTVPNPEWPYLDDDGRIGHFLTTQGTPPACDAGCESDEGDFECVTDGCGVGMDCCLPKDDKEVGAGFLIADSPASHKILRPEVAYMQYDGAFSPEGGSEPAYNLSTFLGTEYKNDQDVTFITSQDGPGVEDVWMTGYLDGECDINDDPIVVDVAPDAIFHAEPAYCGGKVSYLGGHSYLGKAGQRLFLNALFEADCVTNPNWPETPGADDFDSDGDGIPDDEDPFPDDPNRCGDADMDMCDDCTNGYYNPSSDGEDSDGDGICDAGENAADGDGDGDGSGGGCGCRASGSSGSQALLFAFFLGALLRRRRRSGASRA